MSVLLRRTIASPSSSRALLSLASSSSRLPCAFPPRPSSSSPLVSLLSSLSLSTPPAPSSLASRRCFSMTSAVFTPSVHMLKKKRRQNPGWDPSLSHKAKTHKGAQERFRPYKTGLFKHVRAGTNQLMRKNNHAATARSGIQLFLGKGQTRKLKKLMPYWKRTRRQGGW